MFQRLTRDGKSYFFAIRVLTCLHKIELCVDSFLALLSRNSWEENAEMEEEEV